MEKLYIVKPHNGELSKDLELTISNDDEVIKVGSLIFVLNKENIEVPLKNFECFQFVDVIIEK